jgi:hypothetical protein
MVILMEIDRAEIVAYVLMGVGAVLLVITFYMAFTLLVSELGILPTLDLDLSEALGGILGPIANALIKILYLGVMGWVGSVATVRGIQLMREVRSRRQEKKLSKVSEPVVEKEEKEEKAE